MRVTVSDFRTRDTTATVLLTNHRDAVDRLSWRSLPRRPRARTVRRTVQRLQNLGLEYETRPRVVLPALIYYRIIVIVFVNSIVFLCF